MLAWQYVRLLCLGAWRVVPFATFQIVQSASCYVVIWVLSCALTLAILLSYHSFAVFLLFFFAFWVLSWFCISLSFHFPYIRHDRVCEDRAMHSPF